MRLFIQYLSLAIFFYAGCSDVYAQKKSKKQFSNTRFNRVFIYEFEPTPEEGEYRITNTDVTVNNTASNNKQVFLTQSEQQELYNFLSKTSSFDSTASICWQPHLGITFLNNETAVNYVSVCMECNKLSSMLRIKASEPVKGKGGLLIPSGMSTELRKFLNSLLIKYNFRYKNTEEDL